MPERSPWNWSRTGRSTVVLIAAAQNDSELAKVFRNRFIMKSRDTGRALLLRAIEQGAIRADADLEVALDAIYAPLYFRLSIGHGPLDAAFTDALLDTALEGLCGYSQPCRPYHLAVLARPSRVGISARHNVNGGALSGRLTQSGWHI
jgi:hypothetical protein